MLSLNPDLRSNQAKYHQNEANLFGPKQGFV